MYNCCDTTQKTWDSLQKKLSEGKEKSNNKMYIIYKIPFNQNHTVKTYKLIQDKRDKKQRVLYINFYLKRHQELIKQGL